MGQILNSFGWYVMSDIFYYAKHNKSHETFIPINDILMASNRRTIICAIDIDAFLSKFQYLL